MKAFKPMETKIYGHRGARGLFPENTLYGFEKCLENDLTGIEFDVVVSKDNELVISHEPWMNYEYCLQPNGESILKRNQKQHNLFELTLAEIQAYDCGSKKNLFFPHQNNLPAYKPSLKSLFDWLKTKNYTKLNLLIELKSRKKWYQKFQPTPQEYAKLVVDFMSKNKLQYHSVLIKSFDTDLLNEIYKLGVDFDLGVLIDNRKSVKNNLNQLIFKPVNYNVKHNLVTKKLVKQLNALGINLIPWTVNSIKHANKLKDKGVYEFITDYPNLFTQQVKLEEIKKKTNDLISH